MANESAITDEMRAMIGVESEPGVNEIEKGAIRKFAEAIGDPNPLYYDEEFAKKTKYGGIIAPPTFFCTLHTGGRGMNTSRFPFKNLLNGGSEFELIKPLRPGDVITATNKVTGFSERDGRMGKMIFMNSESTFKNQKGEIVGYSRGTTIMY